MSRVVLTGSLEARLASWLQGHPDGHERGAIIFFRKFAREVAGLPPSARFIAVDMLEMNDDWVLDCSPAHIRFNMRKLPDVYLRCEKEGLELGFAHSHPKGMTEFSVKDDKNELNIIRGYAGCNGLDVTLVSLLHSGSEWRGRVRSAADPETASVARHITILSDRMTIITDEREDESPEILQRQAAAFGKPFNRKLRALRAVVVGAGGTGSPLATLIARAGIGELIIIDGDKLEETNLNRVRGYGKADVGKSKADTLAAYIRNLGLGGEVISIPEYVDRSTAAIDAISSADIIFGCTDDVGGRDIMTQAAYYYCLPYIDVGLTGRIGADEAGVPYLRDHRGRVSTILPEAGACLRCQGVVTEAKLKYERALRERPELGDLDAETLEREYYLSGGKESAPGVGPFTSATADMAITSFMNLVRPYRRLDSDLRQDNIWFDFVHLCIHSNMPKIDRDCFCCGEIGLLNRPEGRFRLGMPSLGRIV